MQKKDDPFRDAVFNEIMNIIQSSKDPRILQLLDSIEVSSFHFPEIPVAPLPLKVFGTTIECKGLASTSSLDFTVKCVRKNPPRASAVLIETDVKTVNGSSKKVGNFFVAWCLAQLHEDSRPSSVEQNLIEKLLKLASLLCVGVHWYKDELLSFFKNNSEGMSPQSKHWITTLIKDLEASQGLNQPVYIQVCKTASLQRVLDGVSQSTFKESYEYELKASKPYWFFCEQTDKSGQSYLLRRPILNIPGIVVESHQRKHSLCWPNSGRNPCTKNASVFDDLTPESTMAIAYAILERSHLRDTLNSIPSTTSLNVSLQERKAIWNLKVKNNEDDKVFVKGLIKQILKGWIDGKKQELNSIGIYYSFKPKKRSWYIHFLPEQQGIKGA
jgi:hypothetical protein